mgnify:FL=1|jgi:hypothetical protein
MNKFNIVYSFFFIFTSLILVNNSIKSKELKANQTIDMKSIEGNKEEKGGLKEIDLNNDGKIDYFEFQEIRQRRFDRLDLNNDNIITQEEFEKRNNKFFSEIDQNKDKYLSKLEMFKERKKMKNILE